MAPIKGQYVVNAKGKTTAVLIGLKDYQKMMRLLRDIRDVKFIHKHRHEKLIPMEEIHRNLK